MDLEQKQAEIIDQLVRRASTCNGESLWPIIVDATSHPSLFAFSEILALPNVSQLEGTSNSVYLDVLRLFAHGTWADYKCNASRIPQLSPDQILKLKQLTLLTLAESNKVLPYDTLMVELDVSNVRELEDFLINDCMYAGIIRGKLDQLKRCFEVPFAAGRDLRPGQLANMLCTLSDWLNTSDNLLVSIQEKIKWADNMSEMDKKHRKEAEEGVEELKKSLSMKGDFGSRGHHEMFGEPSGMMNYQGDGMRSKRRRHPVRRAINAEEVREIELSVGPSHLRTSWVVFRICFLAFSSGGLLQKKEERLSKSSSNETGELRRRLVILQCSGPSVPRRSWRHGGYCEMYSEQKNAEDTNTHAVQYHI
ncbi:COP9 signalosome complex subunit 7 [Raphanus sativus]|nr:COP9 signalosome complex subunit 7 [Raphanus sativus]